MTVPQWRVLPRGGPAERVPTAVSKAEQLAPQVHREEGATFRRVGTPGGNMGAGRQVASRLCDGNSSRCAPLDSL
eukprot:8757183-Pyramimonas_sp.AAC.1